MIQAVPSVVEGAEKTNTNLSILHNKANRLLLRYPSLRNPELLEAYALRFAFLVYLLFQINAAFHHGSWGQDFLWHKGWIGSADGHPWRFSTEVDFRRPEPPLFYLFGALIYEITGGVHWLEVIALVSVAVNVIGLLLLYKVLRMLVSNRLLRLSCMIFILFLPCPMIHAEVLATDAFTVPLFVGIVYLLLKIDRGLPSRQFWITVAGVGLLLAIGIGTKFTFESQAIAVLLALLILARTGRLARIQAIKGALVIAAIALLGLLWLFHAKSTFAIVKTGFEMTWGDVLGLHTDDVRVLTAFPYGEITRGAKPTDILNPHGPYEVGVVHKHSYLALVHLALFTDILNIYQYDPSDSYFGDRSRRNLSRMRLAVKTGLIFSLTCLVLTPIVLVRSLYRAFFKRRPQYAALAIIATCALGWFLNIVVFLPSVPTYGGGYWLPRLILPAIVSFVVLTATAIDQFVSHRSVTWVRAILALVVFQSLVHLSFLWPWGVMKPYQ